jgi:dTDP-glucose 4,6-dehydratase
MAHRLLVTGGAGFIGANFVQHLLSVRPDAHIVVLDKLTYAGNLENLRPVEGKFTFVRGDIGNAELVTHLLTTERLEGIINFAAESHVDRSISGPQIFIETNVGGTLALLEAARATKLRRFLQVSTDEVYGSLGATGLFTEDTPLAPNSPYSASKASADMLARAYHHTFAMDVITTRCSNNYGPYQFPEKLIPLMIANALEDKALPVYGDGKNVRDWLHVEDHCSAILLAYEKGKAGETYNIGGRNEWPNIDIVKRVLTELKKPESLIKYVADRLGHDRRYAIDATKIERELGWKAKYTFDTGITQTIKWYLDNRPWWAHILSGEYQRYYAAHYGAK